MTKTTTILVFSAILAIAIGITASTSMVDARPPEPGATEVLVTNNGTQPIPVTGISASPVCPSDKVQHWNKIEFYPNLGDPNRSLVHPTLQSIPDGVVGLSEVIVQVDPSQPGNVRQLVADKLNAIGYQYEKPDGGLIPIDRGQITRTDIEYSTICAES